MKTDKPWGYEHLLSATLTNISGILFNNKILVIDDDERTSLHYHEHRDEMIFVHEGDLYVTRGTGIEQTISRLAPGETVWIPRGDVHRFHAQTGRVVLFESSVGALTDVIRLEDDYDRVDPAALVDAVQ